MIGVTSSGCDVDLTGGGRRSCRSGTLNGVASDGTGVRVPPSEWHSSAHIYTRGQLMACLRAGVIALVLLGVLALIVLY